MTIFGLIGPSGAGKSSVASFLFESGVFVIDADLIAREVTKKGSPILNALCKAFGNDIIDQYGELIRKELSKRAFKDTESTLLLNQITHPEIDRLIRLKIEDAKALGFDAVLIDAAALLESPSRVLCDKIIALLCDKETRLSRIMKRDNITCEQALLRINAQKPDSYYSFGADKTFFNEKNAPLNDICQNILLYINETREKMEKDSLTAQKKDELFKKNQHFVKNHADEAEAVDEFCKKYIDFLNIAKTERECAEFVINKAKENGFVEFDNQKTYKPGDKVFLNNRGKAVILAVIGSDGVKDGARIIASHVDSPRLDLKPTPLTEDGEIAYFKTHYYGGIKKYQWGTVPLSMHGVIVKKNGEKVKISIGEKDGEPQFVVTDLLPHLAKEQSKRPLNEGLKGEELNIVIGSTPLDDGEADSVKAKVLTLLNEMFGIDENDFFSAEIEFVPATKAVEIGLDRSLIGAYGHDDRVCAFPGAMALFDEETPKHTTVMVWTDKEETGSDGNTGLNSSYLKYFLYDLAESEGLKGRHVLSKSKCLSADVNAAFDPNFASAYDKTNACFVNHGVCITKYTGSRGKSGTSDANAEYLAEIRAILDNDDVCWQTGEMGKVDEGGGGTVALYLANLDIETVDMGVPVLSMHAPFEVVSKSDVYSTYKACRAFFKS